MFVSKTSPGEGYIILYISAEIDKVFSTKLSFLNQIDQTSQADSTS